MLYFTGKEIAWIFVALILIVAVAYVVGVLAAVAHLRRPPSATKNGYWRLTSA